MIRATKPGPSLVDDYHRLKAEVDACDSRIKQLLTEFKPPRNIPKDKFERIQKLFRAKNDKISLLTRINQAMILGYRNILERKSCPDTEAKKFVEVVG